MLRGGYEVYADILYKKEIDFVTMKRNEKLYIQVSDNGSDEKTFEQYPKRIIARTRHDEYQYEGVQIVDIADWMLQ